MTTKYDVYGIGNALLDIEFRVDDTVLQSLNIEKGVTTLIDQARLHALLGHLEDQDYLTACGGSAANTLATAAHLGAKSFLSFRVADDDAGQRYKENVLRAGIHLKREAKPAADGVTGSCVALITPDIERTMSTYLGVTEGFSVADLDEQALQQSSYLYIEGYLVASPSAHKAVIQATQWAKKHAVKIALSLADSNIVQHCYAQLMEVLDYKVDVLFCNEQEAKIFAGSEDLDHVPVKLRENADQLLITRGNQGAYFCDKGQCSFIDEVPVKAIDAIGAGDTFAGAYLYAITHDYTALQAAHFANYVAAQVVTKYGPRLSYKEVQNLLTTLPAAVNV